MNRPRVMLIEADENRAFRSMARTVVGHLEKGQLHGRCRSVQAYPPLGSVALEALADRPDRRPSGQEEALVEELFTSDFDALVAFDPLAGVLAERWARRAYPRPLTIGVVGSLWPDPLWRHAPMDRLVVPDERVARHFFEHGHPAAALVPVGLGVCGRFGIGVNEGRTSCRLTRGLPVDAPTLLLVAETLWADDVTEWMRVIATATETPPTLLVDIAGDRQALRAARELHQSLGLAGRVFGRVDEAGVLWGAADRVVGVALDHVVTRALTYRCPFWAIRPADDRQRGLVEALELLGAGSAVASPSALKAHLAAGTGWADPLDAGRLETVASPAVLPRIAETLTQMILERVSGE